MFLYTGMNKRIEEYVDYFLHNVQPQYCDFDEENKMICLLSAANRVNLGHGVISVTITYNSHGLTFRQVRRKGRNPNPDRTK